MLVVDDDSAVRGVVIEALADAGFDCLEAPDGIHALGLARRHEPDAVVLDILMPRVSGDDVYQALRRDPLTRYTPVIFLSAQGESQQKVKRLLDGADDYMSKPFDTGELVARVTAAIRRSQQLRALNPWPGCWTEVDGQRLRVLAGQVRHQGLDRRAIEEFKPFGIGCGRGSKRFPRQRMRFHCGKLQLNALGCRFGSDWPRAVKLSRHVGLLLWVQRT